MFQFTEDCLIGVEQIDEEHRRLFELIGSVMDMLHNSYLPDRYDDIKDLLRELEQYAEQHFEHEEAYMKKIRDPELILQRSQHMAFRAKIREWGFMDIDEVEEQVRMLEEMMRFLAEWLYQHIIGSDIMIGKLPPLEEWLMKENPCEFTEEYLIGIPAIDEEHRQLFRLIDRADRLVKEGVSINDCDAIMALLGELKDYTEFHFADEEKYMESIHYEGLEAQKRAHQAFISKVNGIQREELEREPQQYMQSLVEFLLGWLINHILNADKKIPAEQE